MYIQTHRIAFSALSQGTSSVDTVASTKSTMILMSTTKVSTWFQPLEWDQRGHE